MPETQTVSPAPAEPPPEEECSHPAEARLPYDPALELWLCTACGQLLWLPEDEA